MSTVYYLVFYSESGIRNPHHSLHGISENNTIFQLIVDLAELWFQWQVLQFKPLRLHFNPNLCLCSLRCPANVLLHFSQRILPACFNMWFVSISLLAKTVLQIGHVVLPKWTSQCLAQFRRWLNDFLQTPQTNRCPRLSIFILAAVFLGTLVRRGVFKRPPANNMMWR